MHCPEEELKESRAVIRLTFASDKQAGAVLDALRPETRAFAGHRSRVVLERDHSDLIFKVEARDIAAFRASLNSFLLWINAVSGAVGFASKTDDPRDP